jgi:hypothetical protein
VLRGRGVWDVYASVDQAHAAAVRSALNELDDQDLTG